MESSNQNTSQPNIVSAINAAHGAASQVEHAFDELEKKLAPVSDDAQPTQTTGGGAPAPDTGKLHSYIAALEKRLYSLEARASDLLGRIHL